MKKNVYLEQQLLPMSFQITRRHGPPYIPGAPSPPCFSGRTPGGRGSPIDPESLKGELGAAPTLRALIRRRYNITYIVVVPHEPIDVRYEHINVQHERIGIHDKVKQQLRITNKETSCPLVDASHFHTPQHTVSLTCCRSRSWSCSESDANFLVWLHNDPRKEGPMSLYSRFTH